VQDAFFEWDDEKAAANRRHHGVSFDEARLVFDDIYAIELHDRDHSTSREPRFIRIGLAGMRLLFVSYTMSGQRIRIIHARAANKQMERIYESERHEN
jgi:uncharacterized protein